MYFKTVMKRAIQSTTTKLRPIIRSLPVEDQCVSCRLEWKWSDWSLWNQVPVVDVLQQNPLLDKIALVIYLIAITICKLHRAKEGGATRVPGKETNPGRSKRCGEGKAREQTFFEFCFVIASRVESLIFGSLLRLPSIRSDIGPPSLP